MRCPISRAGRCYGLSDYNTLLLLVLKYKRFYNLINKGNVMSTYLFHIVEDKPERVLVEALEVEALKLKGYCVRLEDLDVHTEESDKGDNSESENEENELELDDNSEADDNKELTIDEVKELARAAGITVGRKGIKTLKKELGI